MMLTVIIVVVVLGAIGLYYYLGQDKGMGEQSISSPEPSVPIVPPAPEPEPEMPSEPEMPAPKPETPAPEPPAENPEESPMA